MGFGDGLQSFEIVRQVRRCWTTRSASCCLVGVALSPIPIIAVFVFVVLPVLGAKLLGDGIGGLAS
jgi:hypothetical protein